MDLYNFEHYKNENELIQDIKDCKEELAEAEEEIYGLKLVVEGQQEVMDDLVNLLKEQDVLIDSLINYYRLRIER